MKTFLLHLYFIFLAATTFGQAVSWELSAEPGNQAFNNASFESANFDNCFLTHGAGVGASNGAGSMNSAEWFEDATPTTLTQDPVQFAILANPATCSITTIALSNIICHDNGTPTITSDDYMIFTLNPSGVNLGTTYDATATISIIGMTSDLPITQLGGSPATDIPYGSPVQLRTDAGSLASGLPISFTVTVTDDGDNGCTQTGSGTMPPFCSVPCNLTTIALSNIICHDNGTPTITSDDYMIFTLNPSGVSLGTTYDATATISIIGITSDLPITQLDGSPATDIPYGSPVQLRTDAGSIASGLPISFTVTVTDDGDSGCTQTGSGTMPPFCSSPPPICTITVDFFGNPSACNDNGTPNDPSDDFFTQNIHASFFNRPTTGSLQIVPGGDQIGTYSIPVNQIVGNQHLFTAVQLKADGTPSVVQMNFTDNPGCIDAATGPTVQSCSAPPPSCTITVDFFGNPSACNDNGTPNDPSDDFFTQNIHASFFNRPTTGSLQIVPGGDQIGTYSIPVNQIVGNQHLFTAVQLKADGTPSVVQMNFTDNPGCIDADTGPSVNSCSNGGGSCAITNLGLVNQEPCDDNGTPNDPTDDFYIADINVFFENPPATGLLVFSGADFVDGDFSFAVANVLAIGSPFPASNRKFRADGQTTSFVVEFTDAPGCVASLGVTGVDPCSFPPPVLTCPPHTTVSCANNVPPADPTDVLETHDCPGNVSVILQTALNNGQSCPNRFTVNRIYQATDECGQTATCSQLITVNDQTKPTMTCPINVTVSCASQVPPANINAVTNIGDNCGGAVTVSNFPSDFISNQTCANRFVISRSYFAVDVCGNSQNCIQTITVNDQTKPTMTCPINVTVSCASQVPPANINAVTNVGDNCGGAVTVSNFPSDFISNQTCANRFVISRSYFAVDVCGNSQNCIQTITVNDQTSPTLTCPAAQTVSCAEQVPAPNTALVTGSDNCGGAIAPSFFSNSISNQTCINRFTLTRQYRAADLCGNTSSCTQIITVNDQIPPVFTSVPPNVTVDCYLVPGVGIATASDNCTSGAAVAFLGEVETPGICPVFKILTRTWRATDPCGNSSTAIQVVTVTDTNAPQFLVLPKNNVVECGPNNAAEFQAFLDARGGAVVQDCAAITYSHEDSPIQNNAYNCGNTFRNNIRFIATDECGNSSFRDASFTVVDLTPPVFTTPPQSVAFECEETYDNGELAFYDWLDSHAGAVAEDACGAVTLEKVLIWESHGCGNTWKKTYEFRAYDQCSNLIKTTASFAVVDNTPPTLVCAPSDNIYLPCIEAVPAADPTALSAYDCSSVTFTLQETWTDGTGCPNWPMTLVYRYAATDACGNVAVCDQVFYVKETNAPALNCPDTIKVTCVDDIPGPLQLFDYIKNILTSDCAGPVWSIKIQADSGEPQNGATHRTYSIIAKNHCGLVTTSCNVTFQATGACKELCSASQVSWGDPNGTVGGINTTDAIGQLIQAYGPVSAGGGNRTVTASSAACVQEMLFGSGTFMMLPTGQFTCPLPANLSNADGSLSNQLAANAMALQLNIWFNLKFNDRDLGVQNLHNLPPCLVEFPLLKKLAQHSTVQDLLDLTNEYLQNLEGYYAPDLPGYLNAALDNLNYFRVDCELNAPCEKPAIRSSNLLANTMNRVYPNPTTGIAMLEFWAETEGDCLLKIADAHGAQSVRNVATAKGLNRVEVSLKNLSAGVYWVTLQSGKKVETLRLVKVD